MKKFLQYFVIALKGEEKEFTKGSINRALMLLAVPMILEMLMESLFAVVDAFFVAKVGIEAVATVGLTESVITLIYSIAIGMSMAATAMVARRIGEKDPEAAAVAAAQSIILSVGLALILGVLGFIFAADILRFMGASPEVIDNGLRYTQIMFGSNVVIILLFLLNGVFRGAGDASKAMTALFISNGLNIILDPIFIFGLGPVPAMGVQGAAVATCIGRSIGVGFQFYILFRKSELIRLTRKHFVVVLTVMKRLISIASNGALQFIIASASWIFLMRIIATFGSNYVAGYTIGIRLIVFTILPAMGIANAAATMVGQNLGANQPDRAEASVWKAAFYNMLFLLSVSVLYIAFAHPILVLFDDTPSVVESGVLTLRIISAGYLIYGYAMVIGSAFNGAGDTRTPMFINIVCFWLMQIPLGYYLALEVDLGLSGVCWAIVISETVMAVFFVLLFRRGKWKAVQI